MTGRAHYSDYDEETTARCERVLLTLLGDLGPWRDRIYLAGGLAPRYLVGKLPPGARAHVGTTDVDVVIGLALGDETPETYRTLENNLKRTGFRQGESSFQWVRDVDAVRVKVEFLCETDQVEPGRIYRPRSEHTGPSLGAFNVRGAHLVRDDFIECEIEGERLDRGGNSRVSVRVANVLPYVVLKAFAFQDRHENKDAYDPLFTLLNHQDGPRGAGLAARRSPIAKHPDIVAALSLLEERFSDVAQDGPNSYAAFLAMPGADDEFARLRREAVATIREFLSAFRNGETTDVVSRG